MLHIPSNLSLEEAIKYLDLSNEVTEVLEEAEGVQFDTVYELTEELNKKEEELEKLREEIEKAKNLVSFFEQELCCKDFRYTETKNLVKKLLSLIEENKLEE